MAIPPQITPMPPAPVRTQAGATYAAVADTFAAALVQLTPQMNDLASWENTTAVQVAADALFAGQAADRAEAVDTNVSEQVDEAAAYAASAKASATAAESAQGSLGNLALMYAIALAS